VAKKRLEDWGFEGVEEEGERGGAREVEGEDVLLEEADWGDGCGCGVGSVDGEPMVEVELRGVG
jgi:hypothetical protein